MKITYYWKFFRDNQMFDIPEDMELLYSEYGFKYREAAIGVMQAFLRDWNRDNDYTYPEQFVLIEVYSA